MTSERVLTVEQKRLLAELDGIRDQIEKGHFLNVHFRAFRLSHDAWMGHIQANAIQGPKDHHSPGGAVLDPDCDGSHAPPEGEV